LLGESKAETTAIKTEDELWRHVFKRLVVWTAKSHRMNPADAEETVQEAIRLFLKAGGQADPADPRALLLALGSKVNGIAVNRRRKKAELAVRLTDDGSEAEPDRPSSPEERIVDAQVARKAVSTLLDRVGDDQVVTDIIMQTSDGVEDPADQAKAIGCGIRDVYNGRRRLKTHVDAVRKLMEGW